MNTRLVIVSFAILLNVQLLRSQAPIFTQTNGPFGGEVDFLCLDSSGNIFAGTAGGIYRSNDNGQTWDALSSTLGDPYGAPFLALNSHGHIFTDASGRGIVRSIDNGYSWQSINSGLPVAGYARNFARSLVIDFSDRIFISSDYGVFQSTDNGETWIPSGSATLNLSRLAVTSRGTLFATGWNVNRLYRSTNSGATWDTLSTGIPFSYEPNSITTNADEILLSTDSGLLYSIDNGNTWKKIFSGYVDCACVDSSGGIYLAAGQYLNGYFRGVYRSTDKGITWTASNSTWQGVSISHMIYSPKSRALFLASQSGIYRSIDSGETWEQINDGLQASTVNCFWVHNDGSILVTTTYNGVFKSTNFGISWTKITPTTDTHLNTSLILTSRGHIFVGRHNYQGLFRSTDMGQTWKQVGFQSRDVFALAISRQDHIFAAVWGEGIYRSTDNGDNWTNTTQAYSQPLVSHLAINSNGTIFADLGPSGLARSTDDGMNWHEVQIAPGYTGVSVWDIAVANNGHVIISVDPGGLFQTSDDGVTWKNIPPPPAYLYAGKLAFNSVSCLFAAYLDRKYRYTYSTNEGVAWQEPDTSFSLGTGAMAFDSSGHLFLGTQGHGVFRTLKSTTSYAKLFPSVTQLVFGSAPVNDTRTDSICIKNKGGNTLVISSIQVFNPDFRVFQYPMNTSPSDSFFLKVAFDPSSVGNYSSILVISSNAVPLGTMKDTIQLAGVGTTPSSVEHDQTIPKEFSLSQNYPNPFNPSTTIQYDVPTSSHVLLKVYNLLGQAVATLIDEVKQPGRYAATWESRNLPTGVYFYRMQAADFVQTKKLILFR
ncbi:MAG: T9SS type A sorting domain-containing protein [Bacteroidota bacterium]